MITLIVDKLGNSVDFVVESTKTTSDEIEQLVFKAYTEWYNSNGYNTIGYYLQKFLPSDCELLTRGDIQAVYY